MVGWHHRLNEHEFEPALGDGEGQRSLAYFSPWDCKPSHEVGIYSAIYSTITLTVWRVKLRHREAVSRFLLTSVALLSGLGGRKLLHPSSPEYILLSLKKATRDFPGGPVAKTPHSQCRGPQVQLLFEELESACHNQRFPHAATKIKDPACHN